MTCLIIAQHISDNVMSLINASDCMIMLWSMCKSVNAIFISDIFKDSKILR